MFYCDECADKNKWPESLSKSRGKCEICGETAVCNDTPSNQLLKPPAPKTTTISGVVWATGLDAQNMLITPEAMEGALKKLEGRPVPVTQNFNHLQPPIGKADLAMSETGKYLLGDFTLLDGEALQTWKALDHLQNLGSRMRPGFTILSNYEEERNGQTVTVVTEMHLTEVSLCIEPLPIPYNDRVPPLSYWQNLGNGKTYQVNDPAIVTNATNKQDGSTMVSYRDETGMPFVREIEEFVSKFKPI